MTIKLEIRDEAHAMALAQYCKRMTFGDAYNRADACDGEERRKAHTEAMIKAIEDLEDSLANAGYCPR